MADDRVRHRVVNERAELVELEMPDVFADVVWWHRPRGRYGPVTVTPNAEAIRDPRERLDDLDEDEE